MPNAVALADRAFPVQHCENRLIAAIYETALLPSPWRHILELLGDHFAASKLSVAVDRRDGISRGVLIEISPRNGGHETRHLTMWDGADPFETLAENHVIVRNAGGAQKVAAMRTPATHAMGLDLRVGGKLARLRLYRARPSAGFTPADAGLLERLQPHIAGTLGIAANTARARSCNRLHDLVMNRVRIGLLVISGTDEIAMSNQIATAMLAGGDGIRLVNNRLEGCHAIDTANLWQMIRAARAEPGRIVAGNLSRPCGSRDMSVMARSVPDEGDGLGEPGGDRPPDVAVFLRDMTLREAMDRRVLSEMFGFTNAEVRLAAELAVGLSVEEAATKLGIRITTARGYLRSIFVKAGVNRQAELIRLLLI